MKCRECGSEFNEIDYEAGIRFCRVCGSIMEIYAESDGVGWISDMIN
jgi:transcription initiation factor TFIIIB Brf1 subunit/transcription initiation factor TFIIB